MTVRDVTDFSKSKLIFNRSQD